MGHIRERIPWIGLALQQNAGGNCCRTAPEQESKAKEAIAALKAEVTHLQRLAEAGQALSSGEEATLAALVRQKEELTKERDQQVRVAGRL